MHSAIYRGYLRHRRFTPNAHKFSYRVFMMYLDLDEIDEVFAKSPLWSHKPWRPARFQRNDFHGDSRLSLKQAIVERIYLAAGTRHKGSVRMLANLRYFGYVINPICCYYCFDPEQCLRYIVVEVTNTPWQERQSYVLACDPQKRMQQISFQKLMHVSPFNAMGLTYHWCSNNPAKILSLNLGAERDKQLQMDATLALKRQEITSASLNGVLLQHPWMSAKVATAIYWQALRLWLKGNPVYDHPPRSGLDAPDPITTNRLKTKT